MFPSSGSVVYRNEAGEVVGWDNPLHDDPPEPEDGQEWDREYEDRIHETICEEARDLGREHGKASALRVFGKDEGEATYQLCVDMDESSDHNWFDRFGREPHDMLDREGLFDEGLLLDALGSRRSRRLCPGPDIDMIVDEYIDAFTQEQQRETVRVARKYLEEKCNTSIAEQARAEQGS